MNSSEISVGVEFPNIKLKTTLGELALPEHYKNKWFVLFSHPKNFTAICTAEFVSFAKSYSNFKSLNCELVGYSLDTLESHKEWVKSIYDRYDVDISYPIVSDAEKVISSKLGILYSKHPDITLRSTFIVDSNSVIRSILHYPPELPRNVDEILRIVEELQKFDEKNNL